MHREKKFARRDVEKKSDVKYVQQNNRSTNSTKLYDLPTKQNWVMNATLR